MVQEIFIDHSTSCPTCHRGYKDASQDLPLSTLVISILVAMLVMGMFYVKYLIAKGEAQACMSAKRSRRRKYR